MPVWAVALTAHLYIPAIDKRRVPGTMSKAYVTDLLQKKMHFNGLIFTDALGMEGAKEVKGSVCVNAFLAGNDILLMPNEVVTWKLPLSSKRLPQVRLSRKMWTRE